MVTSKKSNHIQILRGVAIIAVVLIHTIPGGLFQVFARPFLNFCVGLFLFLSGMLSDAKKWSPLKRIIKVVIPYLIWSLVYVVLNNIGDLSSVPWRYVTQTLQGRSEGMMYYIFVYCEFTLLMPLIDKLARSKMKYLGFIITPVEILLVRTLPVIMGIEVHHYVGVIRDISCLGWFTYFYLGYLMGNQLITVKRSTKTLSIALGVSVILQMAEGYMWFLMNSANSGSQMKITTVLTGAIFVILAYRFVHSEREFKCRPLAFLGDISFGIYFSHVAVIWLLNHIPYVSSLYFFPLSSIAVFLIDVILVFVGRKLLGKFGKYLAL